MDNYSDCGGEEPSSKKVPIEEPSGWDIDSLRDWVEKLGLAGVCNALSAGHLAGIIAPTQDKPLGIDRTNYKQLIALKGLLDKVHEANWGTDSATVTFAFLDYVKSKDNNWFLNVNDGNFDNAFEDFKAYFDEWQPKDEDYTGDHVENWNAKLSVENIYTGVDNLLEKFFDMMSSFQGLIVLKVSYNNGYLSAGHQMSITYKANSRTFEILDQNSGLTSKRIYAQDHIAEVIAKYIHEGYVENPVVLSETDDDNTKEIATNYIDIQFHIKK